MKLDELKQLAEQGKLIFKKSEGNVYVRQMPIYSKTKGFWGEKMVSKFGDAKAKWFGDVEGYKSVSYHKIKYFARTKEMRENEFWKITKKDYEELSNLPPSQLKDGR